MSLPGPARVSDMVIPSLGGLFAFPVLGHYSKSYELGFPRCELGVGGVGGHSGAVGAQLCVVCP